MSNCCREFWEILAPEIPEILAGAAELKSPHSDLSSLTPGLHACSREREDAVFDDRKRGDVRLLLAADVPQERVAQQLGVSLRTVQRIAREMRAEPRSAEAAPAVAGLAASGPGRPSAVAAHAETVAQLLAEEPSMKSLEVLRRLRERGYGGGKTAVYELVKRLRPQAVRPICRFEGVAGEFSQHDFGQVQVAWKGGGQQQVQFFASRLKYSRFAQVRRVPDQRVEALLRALAGHLERFGGLPLMAVFDRPKTIVLRSGARTGEVLEWNPTFADVTARLGVAVELCWPYQPQQKGTVENLVGWVKNSFFKPRQFVDEQDLDLQLQAWHEEVNERRPSRATGRIPGEVLRQEELGRLRPLKLREQQLDLRIPVRVGPTGMVTYETNRYSMPAEALGYSATLHLFADRVVIAAGRYQAEHPRLTGRNQVSSLAPHRAGLLAAVSGQRSRTYLKRQQLLELGRDAERILTELVHARPRHWPDDVERLHELLQACGSELLREAFARVAQEPRISVPAVLREVHGQAPLFAIAPEDNAP